MTLFSYEVFCINSLYFWYVSIVLPLSYEIDLVSVMVSVSLCSGTGYTFPPIFFMMVSVDIRS